MDREYRTYRLRTGEILLCTVAKYKEDFNTTNFTTIYNPIAIQLFGNDRMNMANWMPMSEGDEYKLSTDMILSWGGMRGVIREQYDSFVKQIKTAREEEERDEALVEFLKSVTPGRPIYEIADEIAYRVDSDTPPEKLDNDTDGYTESI